jgi:hypothetical protein
VDDLRLVLKNSISKATRIGNKFGNFNDDDIVVDLEVEEDNTSIKDDAMPPPFSHGYISLESKLKQLESYKNMFML